MKLQSTFYSLALSTAVFAGCVADIGDEGSDTTSISAFEGEEVWVRSLSDGSDIQNSKAKIDRESDGIYIDEFETEFTPGDAVNLYLASFNNPELCTVGNPVTGTPCGPGDFANAAVGGSVLLVDGAVVDEDGKIKFKDAFMPANDTSDCVAGPPCRAGITNPEGAEIHLVIRSHGEASSDPATLEAQLSTWTQGCPAGGCFNPQGAQFIPAGL